MNVLILSCNTGEGHNAAGRAMEEYLNSHGHSAFLFDYLTLAGKNRSEIVSGLYIGMAKYTPGLFSLLYRAGEAISNDRTKSPVYFANQLMGKRLKKYLEKNPYDAILMPHLYPTETITYMKKKGWLSIPAVAICTDYTCIPFWEETSCDGYIIPHEDLMDEFEEHGVPREKLYPYGIPVGRSFYGVSRRAEVRERLQLPQDVPLILIMSGSMGFGKIRIFTFFLQRRCSHGEEIVVICGKNDRLKEKMKHDFRHHPNVHIVGFTKHVADYMDACDVVYTKPGGLTSTEVAVKNRPLVHTAPIPGCETANQVFFEMRGMSMTSNKMKVQMEQGLMLLRDGQLRESMLRAQQRNVKMDTAEKICELLERLANTREA